MKKSILVLLSSCVILFSCVSTPKNDSSETETSVEKNAETSDINNDAEFQEEENAPETFVEQDKSGEPEEIQEIIEAELTPEEEIFEEKIQEEDLKEDFALLNEEIKSENSAENEITAFDNNETTLSETNAGDNSKDKEANSVMTAENGQPKETVLKTESNSKEEIQNQKQNKENKTSFTDQKDASEIVSENPQQTEPQILKDPDFSRTVSLKKNQMLDILYPGKGWVYLGEFNGLQNMLFVERKFSGDDTVFVLRSKKEGRTILHFCKNDLLAKKYIDDYVEINIDSETAIDTEHAKCPDYASVVPAKPKKPVKEIPQVEQDSGEESQEKESFAQKQEEKSIEVSPKGEVSVQTIIKNTDDGKEKSGEKNTFSKENIKAQSEKAEEFIQPEKTEDGSLLELAEKAYEKKDFPKALSLVKQHLNNSSEKIDYALFLEGQILEAKSSVQNIKDAINDYDTVVKNWPQSSWWKKANDRSIYLKRFYIDIR